MKTKLVKPMTIIGLFLCVLSITETSAQDSITQKSQMLDLKLQLLDSKLELLDSKIKLWEAKPKELDTRLTDLNSRMNSMDFNPQLLTRKVNELDSLFKVSQKPADPVEIHQSAAIEPEAVTEPVVLTDYKSSVMLDPVRLLEGTFSMAYERVLDPRFSVNIGLMATYSTKQGISNYYFSNQSFAYLDAVTNQYHSYQGEVMSGGGITIQFRNYLLANHPGRQKAPLGLYAAPQIMYRNMSITGNYKEMEETTPGVFEMVDKKVVQHLNIYAGGVVLGMKVPLFKVLAVDLFAGGNIRLSKYRDEDGFTKYKNMFNIDFSGVSAVAGIAIGILK